VDDDIFHRRIVYRALGAAAPGLFGFGIAVIDPNKIKLAQVGELKGLRVRDMPAHNKVKFLHRRYHPGER